MNIDQIKLDDVAGFWDFFGQINKANHGRTVPVSRRTCRALAGGFEASVMALMIALMIRSLFWHKNKGEYRIDGRTKLSWVADTFGRSRRSITGANKRLIELGWITPIETPQWKLNKWGQRYVINVDSYAREEQAPGSFGRGGTGEIASPHRDFSGEIASPCLNSSTPSTKEDLNTRRPAPSRPGPAGVSTETSQTNKTKPLGKPTLRDIAAEDLCDTSRLLDLHQQAVHRGDPVSGEGGLLDFIALAERSRAQADNPPAMFAFLLKNRRFDYITLADEDAASERLRSYRNGPRRPRKCSDEEPVPGWSAMPKAREVEFDEDERTVLACIQVAKKRRGVEPARIAREFKGWSIDKWDAAFTSFNQKQHDRWHLTDGADG